MSHLPGLNFQLGEDIDALRDAVRDFALGQIAPRAAEIDKSDQFPMDLWPKMGELGVLGITVPEAYGGAMGAVADIAGGYAGLTIAPEGMEVVTAEYKINFLGSYQGGALRAIGRVVKPGKRLIVCTAEVVHVDDDGKQGPCALMQQTLVPVPKTY